MAAGENNLKLAQQPIAIASSSALIPPVLLDRKMTESGKPDLVTLWEAHCKYEFEYKDVESTMASMVPQPYVNHIPTLTGQFA